MVLIFVSAGLVAYGIAEFTETGWLPTTPIVFDLGGVLPVTGLLGSLLAGLFGYTASPTFLQLAGYLAYLLPILLLFVGVPRRPRAAAIAAAIVAVAAVVGACGGSAGSSPSAAASAPPGTTTIEIGASEYRFDPSSVTVPAGTVAFHVTNTGHEEHEFEIFSGDQVVDEVEGLVPGLDRTLTVDLAAGEYTYVCKLAGHEAAGMHGTLSVTGG